MSIFKSLLAAATVVAALAGPAVAETAEINFGIISTEATQNLKPQWEPFLAAMEKATGLKVHPFYASDYAGVIEAMRFNKVQVAWYGNKAAMEAVDRAGGEVFAQSVDAEGYPGYWGVLVANVNSPLKSVDDVLKCDKTLSFGNGDPNSTSGFLVPATFVFAAKGVNPKDCFKTVTNASHEANLLAVANGQVDFATNNTESLRHLAKSNPEALKKIRVIWTSPLIPSDPLVWKKDLDQATKDKLYTFLLTYGRLGSDAEVADAKKVLATLLWAPFQPSSDAQLYPIRIMALTKKIAQVQDDAKLSAEEKTAEIAKLKAERDRIEALVKANTLPAQAQQG